MESFGKNLKKIRLERNISIKEMAKGVGVSPSTILNWEKKAVNLRFDHVVAILKFLQISCDELLGINKKD